MAKTIGFSGGNLMAELGSANEMASFYFCVHVHAGRMGPPERLALVSDRLFKRYVAYEDLPMAVEAMAAVRTVFSQVPASTIDWADRGVDGKGRLDISRATLGEVYATYFDKFAACATSSASLFEKYQARVPVATVVTDLPEFFAYKDRPREVLDALSGEPFWYR